jgi:hypothetical protein
MSDRAYAELLEKARTDLVQAKAEKLALEHRIGRLERTVLALTSLVDDPKVDPAMGITEGIKAALRLAFPRGVSPTALRRALEDAGFDFSNQKNPMASIHSILKRLQKKGHIESQTSGDGGTTWSWISDIQPTLSEIRSIAMPPMPDLFDEATQFFAEDEH